ncbi:uncharacterized protein LOC118425024 [Branchiostoma floridae]|uniref:Uncharacterized protein LOC118425024 n=1 Tax=Branchiostoma floridae TaxID=7739 RepID=A0A9J7N502_BRAFL|nr:uncharacterized protein LOC118425024 [Branchiostoma floridae]
MADIYEDACVVNPASFSDKKGASLDLSSGGDDKTELSSSESDDVSTAPDVDDRHDYIPGIGMATANQSRARPCPVLNVISFLLLLLICCLLAVVVSMYLAVQQSINQGQEKMGKVTNMEQLFTNELSIILEHQENLTNRMRQQMMTQEAMMKKLSIVLEMQKNITSAWDQQIRKLSIPGGEDQQVKAMSRAIVAELWQKFIAMKKMSWFG